MTSPWPSAPPHPPAAPRHGLAGQPTQPAPGPRGKPTRSWLPRWALIVCNVAVGIALLCCGIVLGVLGGANATGAGLSLARPGADPGDAETALALMAWVLWLTVFVRTRWPFVPLVAGAVLAVIGMDYLLMLVGAWQVVVRRGRRTAMWTALGTAVVVAFTVVRDSLRAPLDSVAGGLLATTADGDGVHEPQRWAVVALLVFLAVFGYGLTVGLAYLIRSHRTELRASSVAGSARAQARAATTELNRRSERDRFAQEVHDTLAHRLSLLSLQSGALQVRTQRIAPELSRAAGDVQAQAHASMQDLRVLLGELTGPDEAVGPPSAATLRTIPELVRSTRAAGARVDAVVLVDSSTAPTDVLDHAAYRIVQECLTNAVKHAPGQAVDLYVSAEAGSGVQIRASNPLPGARAGGAAAPGGAALAGTPGGPGMPGGAGLDGIRERAKVLGGTSRIGPDQGVFTVDVFLPWSSRTPPPP